MLSVRPAPSSIFPGRLSQEGERIAPAREPAVPRTSSCRPAPRPHSLRTFRSSGGPGPERALP